MNSSSASRSSSSSSSSSGDGRERNSRRRYTSTIVPNLSGRQRMTLSMFSPGTSAALFVILLTAILHRWGRSKHSDTSQIDQPSIRMYISSTTDDDPLDDCFHPPTHNNAWMGEGWGGDASDPHHHRGRWRHDQPTTEAAEASGGGRGRMSRQHNHKHRRRGMMMQQQHHHHHHHDPNRMSSVPYHYYYYDPDHADDDGGDGGDDGSTVVVRTDTPQWKDNRYYHYSPGVRARVNRHFRLSKKNMLYTCYYCEENVWWLCRNIPDDLLNQFFVVFISNSKHRVPVWQQLLGDKNKDFVTIWDYHVILIHMLPPDISREQNVSSLIYDLDSCLPFPVDAKIYVQRALRPNTDSLSSEFQRKFRVCEAREFMSSFSSDRSHMRGNPAPPPFYPPIQADPEVAMNLDSYVDMNPDIGPGTVLDMNSFVLLTENKRAAPTPSPHHPSSVEGVTFISQTAASKADEERKHTPSSNAAAPGSVEPHIPAYHSRKKHSHFVQKARRNLKTAEMAKQILCNSTTHGTADEKSNKALSSLKLSTGVNGGAASPGGGYRHSKVALKITRTRAKVATASRASKILRKKKEEKDRAPWWDATH